MTIEEYLICSKGGDVQVPKPADPPAPERLPSSIITSGLSSRKRRPVNTEANTLGGLSSILGGK